MTQQRTNRSGRLEFLTSIETLSPSERFQAFMEYRLAPVSDGAKPAELVMLCQGLYDLHTTWGREGKKTIERMGLKSLALKEREECACVLIYDSSTLSRYLDAGWETPLMRNAGYLRFEEDNYLSRLKERFAERCPHEIGLFLGFPYDDVDAFIKNGGRNYLLNGYWKVYGKPERARAMFRKYDEAKDRAVGRYQGARVGCSEHYANVVRVCSH